MSIVDKVVAAVTPRPGQKELVEARANARATAEGVGWFGMILDHHEEIERCFAALKSATDAETRRAAQDELAYMLTGHSLAEETVVYPAMALTSQKAHSVEAYTEQSGAKVEIAALDDLDPMSQEYLDKVEHLEGAIATHVYSEESKWFPALCETADAALHTRLTERYEEEFERYMGAPLR